jgi:hypothetical protein
MAQQCALTATESGGQALPVVRDAGVADRVDTSMEPVESPGPHHVPKRSRRVPKLHELGLGNRPVLLIRQPSQRMVTSPFRAHTGY